MYDSSSNGHGRGGDSSEEGGVKQTCGRTSDCQCGVDVITCILCIVRLSFEHLNITHNAYYLQKHPVKKNLKMYITNTCTKTPETL
jgi:hypothetical protein